MNYKGGVLVFSDGSITVGTLLIIEIIIGILY